MNSQGANANTPTKSNWGWAFWGAVGIGICVLAIAGRKELPELPVTVHSRASLIGMGTVAVLTNTSSEAIEFEAVCRNPQSGEKVVYAVKLNSPLKKPVLRRCHMTAPT